MEVLVQGASGGVGQLALQISKAMGANITAVCSTRNVDNAYSMGAERVIDYKKENVSECGCNFDAILGVMSVRQCIKGKSLNIYPFPL